MVGRSYRGSLNAVMHAKETEVCLLATPSGLLQHLGELATNGLSMVGETGEGNPKASRPHHGGLGIAEDEEVRMLSETVMGNPRSLVIPRHNEHRHTRLGDL